MISYLKIEFENYLVKMGYKKFTPSGNKSTVYDYIGRIENVIRNEGLCTWENFASNINRIVKEYDYGGIKEEEGNKSHKAVINAIKAFKRFLISK